jgi:hypothetical protein
MAGNSKRAIVRLESTAGTGYRYTVTKNKTLKEVLFYQIKVLSHPTPNSKIMYMF